MGNTFIITVLLVLFIVVILMAAILFFHNFKMSFYLKEKERIKDNERIKFFSYLQTSDLPKNVTVSDDDMSLIKNNIFEQIGLSKKTV